MISRRSLLHRALTAAAAGAFVGVCRWLPMPRKAEVEEEPDERLEVVADPDSWNCVVTYYDKDFIKREQRLSIPKTAPPWVIVDRAEGTLYNVTWI